MPPAPLAEFMAATYTHAELRRLAAALPEGGRLAPELPGPIASSRELAESLLGLLERDGGLDVPFFITLGSLDPTQWPQLEPHARALGLRLPERPPRPELTPHTLPPTHAAVARHLVQLVTARTRRGVALQAPLGFGAEAIIEDARRALRQAELRTLPVRIVPDRRSLFPDQTYRAMYAAVMHQVSLVVPLPEGMGAPGIPKDAQPQLHFEEALAELLNGPIRRAGLTLVLIIDGLGAVDRAQQSTWGYLAGRLSNEYDELFRVVAWGGQELEDLRTLPAGEGQFSAFHLLDELSVPPLGPADVAWLAGGARAPGWVDRVQHATGGHPALVAECIRLRDAGGAVDTTDLAEALLGSAPLTRLRRELRSDPALVDRLAREASRTSGPIPRRIDDPVGERLFWLGVWRSGNAHAWAWTGEVMRRLASGLAR